MHEHCRTPPACKCRLDLEQVEENDPRGSGHAASEQRIPMSHWEALSAVRERCGPCSGMTLPLH